MRLTRKHCRDYRDCERCGTRCRAPVCRACRYDVADPEREARILAHAARVEREEREERQQQRRRA